MKTRENNYAGVCVKCGTTVEAFAGVATLSDQFGKWKVQHKAGDCREATLPGKLASVDPKDQAVGKVVDLIAQRMTELVPELVKDNLNLLSRVAEIKVGKAPAVKIDLAHNMLEDILLAVVAGASPMIVGPAGSGKTTLAEQIATILKRKFYMEARVTSEYKLLGFIDAHGLVVRTQFREAYEKGGVFLFDEVDASDADAMTAFNAALANGCCAFPDKLVPRHKDFVAIAAGNTFGRGADRQYVGRNQLDAATLDRFQVFEVDYDEDLEIKLAGNEEWTKRVQKVRHAVTVEKVRHIVSPRASIVGAKLLAAGMTQEKVEEACIWKGLDASNRSRVASRMGETYHA
jgi:cobaltochelatase CobS